MSIKIQNNIIIDDSRNLVNVSNAAFSGPVFVASGDPSTTEFIFGNDFNQTIVGDFGDGTGYIRVESVNGTFDQIQISSRFYSFLTTLTAGTQFTVYAVVEGVTYNTVLSFTQFAGGASASPERNDLYYTYVSGDTLPFSYNATELELTFPIVLPCLTIEQNGSGDRLRVDKEVNDPTPFVIDNSGNVVIGNTSAPTVETPTLTIDKPSPELTIKTGAVGVNGVFGWSIQQSAGELHIKKHTAIDSSTTERVITITTNNRVGILRNNPTQSLDVQGNMGVHESNSGIVIVPELNLSLHTALVSTDTNASQFRKLDFLCSDWLLSTGDANSTSSTIVGTIAFNGQVGFVKSGGGVVTADKLDGLGLDWQLVSSTTNISNTSAVVLSLPTNFEHFSIIVENLVASEDQVYSISLLDGSGNNISSNTYRYANYDFSSDLGLLYGTSTSSSSWPLGVRNTSPGSVSGSLNGKFTFWHPRSDNRWKRMEGISTSYTLINLQPVQLTAFLSGEVDSTTIATQIRISPSTGNFTSGSIHLYGIR